MTEQLIANDLKDVLHRAKDMGCKKVKAFYDIPLENVETVIKALEEIQKYRVLGTAEEVREAVERNQEKLIANISKGDVLRFGTCPTCNRRISTVEGGNYCQNCGQKLDWSEEE